MRKPYVICYYMFICYYIISTNVTNTVAKKPAITVSINYNNKNVVYKIDYFFLALLLIILVLFIIIFICYYYPIGSKQKDIGTLAI